MHQIKDFLYMFILWPTHNFSPAFLISTFISPFVVLFRVNIIRLALEYGLLATYKVKLYLYLELVAEILSHNAACPVLYRIWFHIKWLPSAFHLPGPPRPITGQDLYRNSVLLRDW